VQAHPLLPGSNGPGLAPATGSAGSSRSDPRAAAVLGPPGGAGVLPHGASTSPPRSLRTLRPGPPAGQLCRRAGRGSRTIAHPGPSASRSGALSTHSAYAEPVCGPPAAQVSLLTLLGSPRSGLPRPGLPVRDLLWPARPGSLGWAEARRGEDSRLAGAQKSAPRASRLTGSLTRFSQRRRLRRNRPADWFCNIVLSQPHPAASTLRLGLSGLSCPGQAGRGSRPLSQEGAPILWPRSG
jgi:hypothetical protein